MHRQERSKLVEPRGVGLLGFVCRLVRRIGCCLWFWWLFSVLYIFCSLYDPCGVFVRLEAEPHDTQRKVKLTTPKHGNYSYNKLRSLCLHCRLVWLGSCVGSSYTWRKSIRPTNNQKQLRKLRQQNDMRELGAPQAYETLKEMQAPKLPPKSQRPQLENPNLLKLLETCEGTPPPWLDPLARPWGG